MSRVFKVKQGSDREDQNDFTKVTDPKIIAELEKAAGPHDDKHIIFLNPTPCVYWKGVWY